MNLCNGFGRQSTDMDMLAAGLRLRPLPLAPRLLLGLRRSIAGLPLSGLLRRVGLLRLAGPAVLRRLLVAERLAKAPVDGVAFHVEQFVEPVLDVVHDGRKVVAVQRVPSLLPQLLQEVAQSLQAVSHLRSHPTLKQVPHGVLQVPKVHQVVGQRLEHLLGIERSRAAERIEGILQRWGGGHAGEFEIAIDRRLQNAQLQIDERLPALERHTALPRELRRSMAALQIR